MFIIVNVNNVDDLSTVTQKLSNAHLDQMTHNITMCATTSSSSAKSSNVSSTTPSYLITPNHYQVPLSGDATFVPFEQQASQINNTLAVSNNPMLSEHVSNTQQQQTSLITSTHNHHNQDSIDDSMS